MCRSLALGATAAVVLELFKPGTVSAAVPLGLVFGTLAMAVLVVLLVPVAEPRPPRRGWYLLLTGWIAAGIGAAAYYAAGQLLAVPSLQLSAAAVAMAACWLALRSLLDQ